MVVFSFCTSRVGCLDHAGYCNNHCHSCLNICYWNMHPLSEAEGSITSASNKRGVSMINFLVEELRRFEMSITSVSKTKL